MKTDYTHISVILDRTGSMEPIADDTIGGFNSFLNEQKAVPGAATLTLVQFDSQDPYEVIHDFRPLAQVPELTRETYVPRASTPLFDALGRGILDLDRRLHILAPEVRPAKVIFVVVTDGQENASREFTRQQIATLLREKQEADAWQFVFLSANLAAIDEAVATGVQYRASLAFDKTAAGTQDAFASLSHQMCELRRGTVDRMAFGAADRGKQKIERRRRV